MSHQRHFEADPESVRAVRRFVTEVTPDSPQLSDVVLIASELATNVVRHAKTHYTVRLLIQPNLIRLEVSDGSSILPTVEDLADSHRGLRIVDGVSERWGVEESQDGKTVWAEFTIDQT